MKYLPLHTREQAGATPLCKRSKEDWMRASSILKIIENENENRANIPLGIEDWDIRQKKVEIKN